MKYDVEVIKSNRKTVSISITREGSVVVRAPYSCSNWQLRKVLEEKDAWIQKHLEQMRNPKMGSPLGDGKENDVDGNSNGNDIKLLADDSQEKLTPEERKIYVEAARKLFTARADYFAPKVGVTYNRIAVKSQKTRWGSCSSKGNLNFNFLLYFAPAEVLDYVVVHELCHRKEMNHSKAFWAEVGKILPDYRTRRKWLRDHGRELEAKIR